MQARKRDKECFVDLSYFAERQAEICRLKVCSAAWADPNNVDNSINAAQPALRRKRSKFYVCHQA